MTPRWPPILGVTGFDFGEKPAISLVVPHRYRRDAQDSLVVTGEAAPGCVEVLLASGSFLIDAIDVTHPIYTAPSNGYLLRLITSISDPIAEATISLSDSIAGDNVIQDELVTGADPTEFNLFSWPIEVGTEIGIFIADASEVVTLSYELYGCLL